MPKRLAMLLAGFVLFLGLAGLCRAQERASEWPERVLITNDNGIEDPKLVELARAFAPIAETFVVTSMDDRSGSTHYVSATKTGALTVEARDLGEGIAAYAIDGFPADAVLLALGGIMKDRPPDLVISGINGGPNLAHDWIGSGTIGAARIAAYVGIPALAVSGVDDERLGSPELEAAIAWVIRLAQSDLVRQLHPGQYLTVSFPGIPPSQIKGVRVAERAGLLADIHFKQTPETGHRQVWQLEVEPKPDEAGETSDAALHQAGYIVVVPMRADEHDYELLDRLRKDESGLPAFSPVGKNQR